MSHNPKPPSPNPDSLPHEGFMQNKTEEDFRHISDAEYQRRELAEETKLEDHED